MRPGQVAWLVWCAGWALVWGTIGWLIFPINLVGILLSVVLMIPAFITARRR